MYLRVCVRKPAPLLRLCRPSSSALKYVYTSSIHVAENPHGYAIRYDVSPDYFPAEPSVYASFIQLVIYGKMYKTSRFTALLR